MTGIKSKNWNLSLNRTVFLTQTLMDETVGGFTALQEAGDRIKTSCFFSAASRVLRRSQPPELY